MPSAAALLAAGLAAAGELVASAAPGAGAAGEGTVGVPARLATVDAAAPGGWRREGRARGIDRWPG